MRHYCTLTKVENCITEGWNWWTKSLERLCVFQSGKIWPGKWKGVNLNIADCLIILGAPGATRTRGTRIRKAKLKKGDSHLILSLYTSDSYEKQSGLLWVLRGYFRMRQLQFSYSKWPATNPFTFSLLVHRRSYILVCYTNTWSCPVSVTEDYRSNRMVSKCPRSAAIRRYPLKRFVRVSDYLFASD